MRLVVMLALLAGCNWIVGLGSIRAPDPDAPPDAPGVDAPAVQFQDCRGKIKFTEEPLFPGFNAIDNPTIRADLQEAFDVESDLDGVSLHHWAATANGFVDTNDVTAVNSPDLDDDPSLTADGLMLVFLSTRMLGAENIWSSTRTARDAPWPQAVPLLGLEHEVAGSVSISPDGLTLYFVTGGGDMYQAQRINRSAPFELGNVVATSIRYPTVSADGLELISEANPNDTMLGLYEEVRDDITMPFSGQVAIQLPSPVVFEPDLSADNHILLTARMRFFTRTCQ